MSAHYAICVVCTGNICRSPMGEAVLRDAFEAAGLAGQVSVCSAGTGAWHVGERADKRAAAVCKSQGLSLAGHEPTVFTPPHFDEVDLVLALDSGHVDELCRMTNEDRQRDKIRLLRSFDADAVDGTDLEIADPYYGDKRDFEIAYQQVVDATPGIVSFVRAQLELSPVSSR